MNIAAAAPVKAIRHTIESVAKLPAQPSVFLISVCSHLANNSIS